MMANTRTEHDSFGTIEVPSHVLWGAQTGRSLHFFAIGNQQMPREMIHALALIKWAAANVNATLGLLDACKAKAISDAALRVVAGDFDTEFPLSVWQTGSGTQSNMNVNEVLSNLATRALATGQSTALKVHPNDDVNLGQSSNDVFPSAMHIAVAVEVNKHLLPNLSLLREALAVKALAFKSVIKIGRTHMQDATPLTMGQEFGGYAAQLALCETAINHALLAVYRLAIGGTAVGTGMNTHPEFGTRVTQHVAARLSLPFQKADNLFAAMAGHEALVALHAGLKMLAIALIKIGNDIRLMGSGPRAGLGEITLPQNEPGSSIMPGKVNPTQIEAMLMVCAQVMGHDAAIGFASSQGQFELNTYKPLIAMNVLDSVQLLSDTMRSVCQHCVVGIEVNLDHVQSLLERSLMLVTALAPHIGYEQSAQVAKYALQHHLSLREAALIMGFVSAPQFDLWVDAQHMLEPHVGLAGTG
jgi:fumarate hydratase, class II